jgi:hypothetical protein
VHGKYADVPAMWKSRKCRHAYLTLRRFCLGRDTFVRLERWRRQAQNGNFMQRP